MVFEVHLEDYYHALELPEAWSYRSGRLERPTYRLLDMLDRHHVRATFYVLGHVAIQHPALLKEIRQRHHWIGSHGHWHRHGEREMDISDRLARHHIGEPCGGYRSPFWDSTPHPGPSGGFFFRTTPRVLLLPLLRKSGVFWIHPHDLEQMPGPWRRQVGFHKVWDKLEWVLNECW